MPYARPISIPVNRTGLTRSVDLSKRVAARRSTYKNRRKIQALPGQIVYVVQGRGMRVVPMRVRAIDDCAIWACHDWQRRRNYMIYYDLQPLTKVSGSWRAKSWRQTQRLGWQQWNKRLWDSGWIGHSIDMDKFCLTSAEANWVRLNIRRSYSFNCP